MTTWDEVALGDHVDLLTGFPFKSAKFTSAEDSVRLLKGSAVSQGDLDWNGSVGWPSNDVADYRRFELKFGDVVLAMDRPWVEAGLKYAWIRADDLPCLLVQRVARLRGRNGLDTTFLRYLIGGPEFTNYIAPIVTGVNVPHISPRQIGSFRFKLPPTPIQIKIAAILSAYDDLIENNTRRIKALEEVTRRTYHEWFVDFRYPGHDISESVSGSVPKGWQVGRLGEHVELIRGRSYRGSEVVDEGGVPFINLKCIKREGGFRDDGVKRYVGDFKVGHKVSTGDIVVAVTDMTQERRIVARAARMPDLGEEFGVFSMDLVKVEPRDLPREFLLAVLQYSNFPDRVKAHANGANVLHLHPERISDFVTAFPPSAIANRYADVVSPMFSLADNLRLGTDRARKARDLLLPRLVTGEIDLSDREITMAPTAA